MRGLLVRCQWNRHILRGASPRSLCGVIHHRHTSQQQSQGSFIRSHTSRSFLCRDTARTPWIIIRSTSSQPVSSQVQDFTAFYKFPYIVHMNVVSRLKLYQTGLVVAVLPLTFIANSMGYIPVEAVHFVTGIAGFATVMLYVMSHFFRRIIGFMYLNKAMDTVKVSHLTFWGRRRDIFLPVDSIVPLADFETNPRDSFVLLKQYDSKEVLYFNISLGGIKDKAKFEHVFGKIS